MDAPAGQERGIQEISDAFDTVVDLVNDKLEENEGTVSTAVGAAETCLVRANEAYTKHSETLAFFSHVAVIFYGPLLEKTVLATKTFTAVSYPMVKESVDGIREEYWKVRTEKKRHGGVINAWIILEAIDPKKIEQCGKGLLSGIAACLVGLHSPHLQIFSSGFSIGEYVSDTMKKFLEPVATKHARKAEESGKLPIGSARWFEQFVRFVCMFVGVYIASKVRQPLITASAIAESSQIVAQRITRRVTDHPAAQLVFQHALTALGLYHVFVLGGHKVLPSPVKALLYVPLTVESFLGVAGSLFSLGS